MSFSGEISEISEDIVVILDALGWRNIEKKVFETCLSNIYFRNIISLNCDLRHAL